MPSNAAILWTSALNCSVLGCSQSHRRGRTSRGHPRLLSLAIAFIERHGVRAMCLKSLQDIPFRFLVHRPVIEANESEAGDGQGGEQARYQARRLLAARTVLVGCATDCAQAQWTFVSHPFQLDDGLRGIFWNQFPQFEQAWPRVRH